MLFKTHLVFAFFLLVFSKSYSQRFFGGLSAGLIASDINGANTRDTDNDFHKVGFTVGGLMNTQISKKSIFQFEINYIQKGSMQPPDSLNNGFFKIALGYVEIPVLIKRQLYFNWKQKKINKIDIEAGISYGRMVHNTVTGSTNYILSSASNYFNTNDISLLIGLDYNFTKNIYFCFRYSNSIIPAIKKNTVNTGIQSVNTFNKGNNMVLQFSFKVVFGAKKMETTNVITSPVGE